MDAEQTWPTEEELKQADSGRKKLVKKIPEGYSEYQAAWIPDCDAGWFCFQLYLYWFLNNYYSEACCFAEEVSEVSDLAEEMEASTDEDSETDEPMDDSKSHVSFAPESVTSEYPNEPDKYDVRVDKEEEKRALQKIKGKLISRQVYSQLQIQRAVLFCAGKQYPLLLPKNPKLYGTLAFFLSFIIIIYSRLGCLLMFTSKTIMVRYTFICMSREPV